MSKWHGCGSGQKASSGLAASVELTSIQYLCACVPVLVCVGNARRLGVVSQRTYAPVIVVSVHKVRLMIRLRLPMPDGLFVRPVGCRYPSLEDRKAHCLIPWQSLAICSTRFSSRFDPAAPPGSLTDVDLHKALLLYYLCTGYTRWCPDPSRILVVQVRRGWPTS